MSLKQVPDFLRARMNELPSRSGVYLFKGRDGKAVYIGKALSLKKRVAGHFRHYGETGSKEGMMLSLVSRIDIVETPSEAEALLLEASLVKEQLPKYNAMLRDDKSYPFLKITGEEYPRLLIARGRKADGSKYFGPYTDVRLLRQAVKMLRREFPLRTCRKMPKKVCLQYHLELCGGPCEAHQDREAYLQTVQELTRFIEGRRDAMVKNLSKRMKEYAARHQFEKAQAMRDAMAALSSMPVSARTAHSPADVLGQMQEQLGLPFLPNRIECFDISNIHGKEAVGSMVVFEGGEPLRKHYRRFRVKTVTGIDDYRMMQEVVKRRYAGSLASKLPKPDLVLIDGGKGHLSAVQKAMQEIKLDIPLLSIAKQHEILFSPDRESPTVLPPSSPVLQMIRHLRDEAHRFAIRYHRLLRGKAFLPVLFLLMFTASAARADMIEIQGEGFVNGTIESETETEVTFKDAAGKTRTVPRKDILFMEHQIDSTPSQRAALKAEQAIKKIAPPAAKPAEKKKATAKKKEKKERKEKSESREERAERRASEGGRDATGALRALANAERAASASNARVMAAVAEAEGGDRAPAKKDAKKGRFGSL